MIMFLDHHSIRQHCPPQLSWPHLLLDLDLMASVTQIQNTHFLVFFSSSSFLFVLSCLVFFSNSVLIGFCVFLKFSLFLIFHIWFTLDPHIAIRSFVLQQPQYNNCNNCATKQLLLLTPFTLVDRIRISRSIAFFKRMNTHTDAHQRDSLDDGRHYRRSIGYPTKRQRPLADSASNASSRGHGESHTYSYDEATLRQLLLEYVVQFLLIFFWIPFYVTHTLYLSLFLYLPISHCFVCFPFSSLVVRFAMFF